MNATDQAIQSLERLHHAQKKAREEQAAIWKEFWRESAIRWAESAIEWASIAREEINHGTH